MKKTVREIARRKNLPANLPRYVDGMMGRYFEFSSVRLALNYHVFCDMQREYTGTAVMDDRLLAEFHRIMERIPEIQTKDIPELLSKVEKLRSTVMDRMQVITSYTDIFHLYEYVLNRVEYRFREGGLPGNYSDDAFCREIMKYIVKDEEPAEVNRKIGEILGQLPIRLTKQKFFELLDAGLSTYMGTDRSGLNDFLYMIRMSAMLEEPDSVTGGFVHLNLAKEEFRVCDYANITSEEYHRLAEKMAELANYLNETSEQYTLFMEQLNDIYVILKSCGAKDLAEADVIAACGQIIRESKKNGRETQDSTGSSEKETSETEEAADSEGEIIEAKEPVDSFDGKINEQKIMVDNERETSEAEEVADKEVAVLDTREDLLDLLVSLEGVQERISEEINTYGYLVDDLNEGDSEELARLGFSEAFRDLKNMENLTSSSLFVKLDAKNTEEIAVDEDYLEEKKEILHSDMEKLFAENSRLVRRAVMATVISQLPVFFENLNSLQDFIYNSLSQCRDSAEKIACVEVISSILAG